MQDVLIFLQEEVLIVVALVVLVAAFYRRESAAAGDKLSLHQVVQKMNADEAVLLDVRDAKEFGAGHVVNAIHIPHAKVTDNFSELNKHKEKCIIVTDQLGQHAGSVCRLLAKEGFTVARMNGGMSEWKQEGLPVVK